MLRRNLARVETWYDNGTDSTNTLQYAFADALLIGNNPQGSGVPLFRDIYLPVKPVTQNGMSENPTYVNIGFAPKQIAKMYADYYGLNYLVVPYTDIDTDTNKSAKLTSKIQSVVYANLYKYLKNIELLGYEYNPMWNVDGTEIYSYADFDHFDTVDVGHTVTHQAGNTHTEQVTTYDGDYKNLSKSIDQWATQDNQTVTRTRTLSGIDVPTDALGNELTDKSPDNYHTEKKVRSGNIGVTTTSQLIAGERENFKYSILEEFFRDINEQILVGIY